MTPQESTRNRNQQKKKASSANTTFVLAFMIWGLDSLVLNRMPDSAFQTGEHFDSKASLPLAAILPAPAVSIDCVSLLL